MNKFFCTYVIELCMNNDANLCEEKQVGCAHSQLFSNF